jgi:hypothetical protein
VLLEEQDRSLWNRPMIGEGLALIDKAMRHRRPGPISPGGDRGPACPRRAAGGYRLGPDRRLYAALERLQPSPGDHAQPRRRRRQVRGAGGGAGHGRAAGGTSSRGYFHFFGLRGWLHRADWATRPPPAPISAARSPSPTALVGDWVPAGPFMVAIVEFEPIDGGRTRYTARARHWTAEAKAQHEQMGFLEGWGQCADQLAELLKTF